jgi:hypothetical protein
VPTVANIYREKWNSEVSRGKWLVKLTNDGIRASFQHWKGRGYDSYILAAPIQIGTEQYIADVIVNHHKDSTYTFYLHEVEKKQGSVTH